VAGITASLGVTGDLFGGGYAGTVHGVDLGVLGGFPRYLGGDGLVPWGLEGAGTGGIKVPRRPWYPQLDDLLTEGSALFCMFKCIL